MNWNSCYALPRQGHGDRPLITDDESIRGGSFAYRAGSEDVPDVFPCSICGVECDGPTCDDHRYEGQLAELAI